MAEPIRAAVLGRPVAHSLSPALHTAAYAALGLTGEYVAIDCGEDDLAGVLDERRDWAGFSLTMPLKRAGLELAVRASPRAEAVGAANTLLPDGGGWRADNTDVAGVLGALAESGCRPAEATVLGAGGTAQAVVVALAELGLTDCTVLVRDPARTTELRRTAEAVGVGLDIAVLGPDAPGLAADLVVSTLPGAAADPLADHGWRDGQHVFDVVYAGWPTPLAAAASTGGAAVINGALMLLHQAVVQVELMTGHAAPVEAMRAGLPPA